MIEAIPVWLKIELGPYGQRRVRQIGPDQASYIRYLSLRPRDFGQCVSGPSRKVRDPERLDPKVACYIVCLTFQLARSCTDLQPYRELHHGRANNCFVRTDRQIGDSSCAKRRLQTGKQVAKVVPGSTARLCGRIMVFRVVGSMFVTALFLRNDDCWCGRRDRLRCRAHAILRFQIQVRLRFITTNFASIKVQHVQQLGIQFDGATCLLGEKVLEPAKAELYHLNSVECPRGYAVCTSSLVAGSHEEHTF